MGNKMCQSQTINRNPVYFFKTLQSNELTDNSEEIKQKVKLTLELKQINDDSQRNISLLIFNDPSKQNSTNGGTTESKSKSNTNNIIFSQFFVMEYYFEKEQPILFTINGGSNQYRVETTLGNIMGSRNQRFIYKLEDNSIFEVTGQGLNNQNMNAVFNISIEGNLKGKGFTYYIKYLGKQNNPQNNDIYKSEVIEYFSNQIQFQTTKIPSMFLAPDGNYEQNIISIEIYDVFHSIKLGEYTGLFSSLINKPLKINLLDSTAEVKMVLNKEYSFLDYLRGGIQINLSIAIDYTASNGNYTSPQSLHYIGTNEMNAYELAIKYCGDILAYYDYDQLFPVYGYGGKLQGEQQVNHCFPINLNPSQPEINTINNVLFEYRKSLSYVTLYGPTFFSPVLMEINRRAREDVNQGNNNNYHILLILTDGIINDMEATVNQIVEASYLPISIIIVGIGNTNFNNMHTLDADDSPLYDSNRRKADRDCVQFVPFHRFSNDGRMLAQEVLAEIPKQLVEYYQHKNIPPSDPIIDIG